MSSITVSGITAHNSNISVNISVKYILSIIKNWYSLSSAGRPAPRPSYSHGGGGGGEGGAVVWEVAGETAGSAGETGGVTEPAPVVLGPGGEEGVAGTEGHTAPVMFQIATLQTVRRPGVRQGPSDYYYCYS